MSKRILIVNSINLDVSSCCCQNPEGTRFFVDMYPTLIPAFDCVLYPSIELTADLAVQPVRSSLVADCHTESCSHGKIKSEPIHLKQMSGLFAARPRSLRIFPDTQCHEKFIGRLYL